MYIFGKKINNYKLKENLPSITSLASKKAGSASLTSTNAIIQVLSKLEVLWQPNSEFYRKALLLLEEQSSFSTEMNKATLEIIPSLFNKDNLLQRLNVEFGSQDFLDDYKSFDGYAGRIKYLPLGSILHVTAGNVFLGCIDSLLMGILTKNISLVKLSSSNILLPHLFIESLELADTKKILVSNICLLHWKGGEKQIETHFKNSVDAIITWGGEEMASSYQKDLPLGTKLLQHGPKISFHILSKGKVLAANSSFYDSIVKDIVMWDQSACANSQNIFLEEGIDTALFMRHLASAFKRNTMIRGKLSPDEETEILKDYQLALYEEFRTGIPTHKGSDFMLSYEDSLSLSPTALNCTVKVKSFKDISTLAHTLSEFRLYLQTCGLGALNDEHKIFIDELSRAGVSRFTHVGQMLQGNIGSPHDGSFALNEFTKVHCIEQINSIEEFALDIISKVPFYANLKIQRFEDIPIIDGSVLSQHSIHCSYELLNNEFESSAKVFSTGGTTGRPKYCLYADEEFRETSKLLAKSYLDLGLNKDDKVLNLFMAGNMWSSFSAIQYSLEYAGVIQFPMGGLASVDEIARLIKDFNINVLFGLPGTILNLLSSYPDLKISKIFYAGEFMSKQAREAIFRNWGCRHVYSAGYATVDVGPIGYQTPELKGSEHYLFNDLIHLEVVDGEAVVTSKVRKAMPILRYRTGDRVRILERTANLTRFELLGRIDERINIWSCRIEKHEVVSALDIVFGISSGFQIVLSELLEGDIVYEEFKIIIPESCSLESYSTFLEQFYRSCQDVQKTVSIGFVQKYLKLEHSSFIVNKKTGKQKLIFDNR